MLRNKYQGLLLKAVMLAAGFAVVSSATAFAGSPTSKRKNFADILNGGMGMNSGSTSGITSTAVVPSASNARAAAVGGIRMTARLPGANPLPSDPALLRIFLARRQVPFAEYQALLRAAIANRNAALQGFATLFREGKITAAQYANDRRSVNSTFRAYAYDLRFRRLFETLNNLRVNPPVAPLTLVR